MIPQVSTKSPFTNVLFLLCLALSASSTSTSPGKISFFSDNSYKDLILTESGTVLLDSCLSRTTTPDGKPALSFISDKPHCPDGKRPSLLLFQDPCCTDGVANYIPDANYGDYGNGSCQALMGGDIYAFVFQCGGFDYHRTAISFSFPTPTTSVFTGCPGPTQRVGNSETESSTELATSSSSLSASGVSDSTASLSQTPSTRSGSASQVGEASVVQTGAASATSSSAAVAQVYRNGVERGLAFVGVLGCLTFSAF